MHYILQINLNKLLICLLKLFCSLFWGGIFTYLKEGEQPVHLLVGIGLVDADNGGGELGVAAGETR